MSHVVIKTRAIAAATIVNQESRWRSVPGAAFHDLLRCPLSRWTARHFDVEDFPVGVPNHEEDMKRCAPNMVPTHILRHGSGGNLEPNLANSA
jgi:hypothetical protein